jgi:L-lactate utilization protein LutB
MRTMKRAAALVDARKSHILERVHDLLQMLLGQVQIPGRGLQVFMAEQELDGSEVCSTFEKVGGKRMSTIYHAK